MGKDRAWALVRVAVGLLLVAVPVVVAAGWLGISWDQSRWPTVEAVVVSSDAVVKGPSSAVVTYEVDGRAYRSELRGSYVEEGTTITVGVDPGDPGTVAPDGGFWYQLWLLSVPAALTTGLAMVFGYPGLVLLGGAWEDVRVAVRSRRPGRRPGHAPVEPAGTAAVEPDGAVAVVAEVSGVVAELEAAFGLRGRRLVAALDAALAAAQQRFLDQARTSSASGSSEATATAWWPFFAKGGHVVVLLAEVRRPCGIQTDGDAVSAASVAALRRALSEAHPALGRAEIVLYVRADQVDPRVPSGIDRRS